MNKITDAVIDTLAKYEGDAVLTMYVPTNKSSNSPNMQEDQTRFKNLMREGYYKLQAATHDESLVINIRDQLTALLDSTEFWQNTTESLAVFAARDSVEIYHIPIEVEEHVYVGSTYDLAPLLILKELNQPFYLFALAQHNSKLFMGDMYDLRPVDISFPSSPEDALNIDEMFSGSNTIRNHGAPTSGSGPASAHGQGDSNHAGQEERLKYFRILDDIIIKSSEIDHTLPILVAGTDSEASDFKALTTNQRILANHLMGNHTKDTLDELHALAWNMIENDVVMKKLHDTNDRCQELVGSNKSSTALADIKESARAGRIDSLLIPMLDETADSISDRRRDALLVRFIDAYERDGLRDLIRTVIKNGGKIIGLERSLMPSPVSVAAIYRY